MLIVTNKSARRETAMNTKRIISVVLTLLLAAAAFPFIQPAAVKANAVSELQTEPALTAGAGTVYVDNTGDDTNTGLSVGVPVKSLKKAFEILGDDGGTIVITESLTLQNEMLDASLYGTTYDINGDGSLSSTDGTIALGDDGRFLEPAHTGLVVIKGYSSSCQLIMGSWADFNTCIYGVPAGYKSVNLHYYANGPLRFEDLTFTTDATSVICGNFNYLVFGTGLTFTSAPVIVGGVSYASIMGSKEGDDYIARQLTTDTFADRTEDTHVIINYGTYSAVVGASRFVSGNFSGNFYTTVKGSASSTIIAGIAIGTPAGNFGNSFVEVGGTATATYIVGVGKDITGGTYGNTTVNVTSTGTFPSTSYAAGMFYNSTTNTATAKNSVVTVDINTSTISHLCGGNITGQGVYETSTLNLVSGKCSYAWGGCYKTTQNGQYLKSYLNISGGTVETSCGANGNSGVPVGAMHTTTISGGTVAKVYLGAIGNNCRNIRRNVFYWLGGTISGTVLLAQSSGDYFLYYGNTITESTLNAKIAAGTALFGSNPTLGEDATRGYRVHVLPLRDQSNNDNVCYVSGAGNNHLDGTTAANAVNDIDAAFNILGDAGGTIILCGDYNFGTLRNWNLSTFTDNRIGVYVADYNIGDSTAATAHYIEPVHSGNVTITSKYGDEDYTGSAVFNMGRYSFGTVKNWVPSANTSFSDITFEATGICTDGTALAAGASTFAYTYGYSIRVGGDYDGIRYTAGIDSALRDKTIAADGYKLIEYGLLAKDASNTVDMLYSGADNSDSGTYAKSISYLPSSSTDRNRGTDGSYTKYSAVIIGGNDTDGDAALEAEHYETAYSFQPYAVLEYDNGVRYVYRGTAMAQADSKSIYDVAKLITDGQYGYAYAQQIVAAVEG